MKYNFSAEFLKVLPPDTTFGTAWESLCFDLLSAELGLDGLQKLNAPDGGIDIWNRNADTAIQCKSDERGAIGTIPPTESVKSLTSAVASRSEIPWKNYAFATNANYSATGVKQILTTANTHSIENDAVDFLGPDYWCELCERHFAKVRDRLDYRLTVTEQQVVEAFRKARYYDKYVDEFSEKISTDKLVMVVKNNWTPVELEFPFSPDLTVENCVNAVQQLLGVSLKWTNFGDIGTSTGPSISLTVDRKGQTFKQTIREVQENNPNKDLEFWITLIWKDETKSDGNSGKNLSRMMYLDFMTLNRDQLSRTERKNKTLERAEKLLQAMIWKSAAKIKNNTFAIAE